MAKEYKIISTTHPHSNKREYAIIATCCMIAEPDAEIGYISLDGNDMYVIANDISHASLILNKAVNNKVKYMVGL